MSLNCRLYRSSVVEKRRSDVDQESRVSAAILLAESVISQIRNLYGVFQWNTVFHVLRISEISLAVLAP